MGGEERLALIRHALAEYDLDAIICGLPANVLMLSGYWPVVGASLAIATRDGATAVIVPEDELNFARRGWAEIASFKPSSLDKLTTAAESAREPLRESSARLGIAHARIGYEGALSEPASYSAMLVYGAGMLRLIAAAIPDANPVEADEMINSLRMIKTSAELEKLRAACAIAGTAFLQGAAQLRAPARETEVASLFRARLSIEGIGQHGVDRADGFVYCMSGANSAQAYGAYARTVQRVLRPGDLVLVHCNSYADGMWTDVTRTFLLGEPDQRKRDIYDAVFAARSAALNAIRPGARAREVDAAARRELSARGFGGAFKHSTGHGVGFGAIDPNGRPRLHPKSPDVLQPGMVMNVEPAVYIENYGGVRHCDMVAVTESGMELLTPFQASLRELIIH
jgi:Xaa-Pro dipeptidase